MFLPLVVLLYQDDIIIISIICICNIFMLDENEKKI